MFQGVGRLVLAMCGGQDHQQVCRRDEAYFDAYLCGGMRHGNMRLPGAARPQQHDVLAALDEGQAGQFLPCAFGTPLETVKSKLSRMLRLCSCTFCTGEPPGEILNDGAWLKRFIS